MNEHFKVPFKQLVNVMIVFLASFIVLLLLVHMNSVILYTETHGGVEHAYINILSLVLFLPFLLITMISSFLLIFRFDNLLVRSYQWVIYRYNIRKLKRLILNNFWCNKATDSFSFKDLQRYNKRRNINVRVMYDDKDLELLHDKKYSNLVMVHGYIGTGKTTFIKVLQKYFKVYNLETFEGIMGVNQDFCSDGIKLVEYNASIKNLTYETRKLIKLYIEVN